jgi:hypothetical protein
MEILPVRILRTKRYSVVVNESEYTMEKERHMNGQYYQMLLFGAIPSRASSLDSTRMMIAMFCVNSIEMMGRTLQTPNDIAKVVEWIYSRQSINGGFDGGSDIETPPRNGQ